MRGQCVLWNVPPYACVSVGEVTIQTDAGGKPSGTVLGTMGFYLSENLPDAWLIRVKGNPTGGTFRLRSVVGDQTFTTEPIQWNSRHRPEVSTALNKSWPDPDDVAQVHTSQGWFPRDAAFVSGPMSFLEATDVQLTGGDSPRIEVSLPYRGETECGRLSPAPQLSAGVKYWAVMTADDQAAWNYWTNTPSEVLESVDAGTWTAPATRKTLAMRIDSGPDTCEPVVSANPAPGTTIGDMTVTPGNQAFNTFVITNTGVSPLTIGTASFSGTGASVFSLLNGQPGPLAQPIRFPKLMGIGSTSIFYVAYTGPTVDGLYQATLNIQTSDPDLPVLSYPVECVVPDTTPPTVSVAVPPADGRGSWWRTEPVEVDVSAVDPPLHRIDRISCSDELAGASWDVSEVVSTTTMAARGLG